MIAMVLMIFVLMECFTGIHKALSLESAMSTQAGVWKDNVKATFLFKNPLHQIQKW